METAIAGEIAKNLGVELAKEAGKSLFKEDIIDLFRRKKVAVIISLVYSFESPVSLSELAVFIKENSQKIGADEDGYIDEIARFGYDFITLFDEATAKYVGMEFEISENEYEALIESVVKLVLSVRVFKWSRRALKRAYDFVVKMLKALEEKYNGRYKIIVYLRGKPRKLGKLKVHYFEDNIAYFVLNPLDYEQVSEFLNMPGGLIGFL